MEVANILKTNPDALCEVKWIECGNSARTAALIPSRITLTRDMFTLWHCEILLIKACIQAYFLAKRTQTHTLFLFLSLSLKHTHTHTRRESVCEREKERFLELRNG